MKFKTLFLLSLLMSFTSNTPMHAQKRHADLICTNGRIHTINSRDDIVSAMAIGGGRILAVGNDTDILDQFQAKNVTDLQQQNVFPGFIDAHAHLYGLGEESVTLTLQDTKSKEEILRRVEGKAGVFQQGKWIRGRGWDQNRWEEPAFPDKADLDRIAPSHPVFLKRVDGHAAWVNSYALALVGITASTPDPPGGKILRRADGDPSGILLDNAADLIVAKIPAPTMVDLIAGYRAAVEICLASGMTCMHDMGLRENQINAIRTMIQRNAFPFRVVGYVDGLTPEWENLLKTGVQVAGDGNFTLAGLKLYADGALGSRGALLLKDYADDPGNRGIQITSQAEIQRETERALAGKLQMCVHAIGDSANRLVLNAYEQALKSQVTQDPRLRIEHVQVLSPQDIPRFAKLGVIPSMQPTHCTSDMHWAEARLGAERVPGAYAWQSLISSGAWIPGGSDFPVERPYPLQGIYAAAFRQDSKGSPNSQSDIESEFQTDKTMNNNPERYKDGWYGAQRMSRMDAIRAFTIWAAKAAHQENVLGSLEAGKYADFVILSRDISTVSGKDFLKTNVIATYLGGKRVFAREEAERRE